MGDLESIEAKRLDQALKITKEFEDRLTVAVFFCSFILKTYKHLLILLIFVCCRLCKICELSFFLCNFTLSIQFCA